MTDLLQHIRRPDIVFYRNGRIDISARVAVALDLNAGDAVSIFRDGHEFYLYVSHRAADSSVARFEAQCFPSNRRGRHMRASSVRLCTALLDNCLIDGSAAFAVGPVCVCNGVTCLPVITRLPLRTPGN